MYTRIYMYNLYTELLPVQECCRAISQGLYSSISKILDYIVHVV